MKIDYSLKSYLSFINKIEEIGKYSKNKATVRKHAINQLADVINENISDLRGFDKTPVFKSSWYIDSNSAKKSEIEKNISGLEEGIKDFIQFNKDCIRFLVSKKSKIARRENIQLMFDIGIESDIEKEKSKLIKNDKFEIANKQIYVDNNLSNQHLDSGKKIGGKKEQTSWLEEAIWKQSLKELAVLITNDWKPTGKSQLFLLLDEFESFGVKKFKDLSNFNKVAIYKLFKVIVGEKAWAESTTFQYRNIYNRFRNELIECRSSLKDAIPALEYERSLAKRSKSSEAPLSRYNLLKWLIHSWSLANMQKTIPGILHEKIYTVFFDMIIAETGCKAIDLIDLEWKDINFYKKCINLTSLQSGKDYQIEMNLFLSEALQDLLKQERVVNISGGKVFPISLDTMRKHRKEVSTYFKLPEISIYTLQSTAAHLARESAKSHQIMQFG